MLTSKHQPALPPTRGAWPLQRAPELPVHGWALFEKLVLQRSNRPRGFASRPQRQAGLDIDDSTMLQVGYRGLN